MTLRKLEQSVASYIALVSNTYVCVQYPITSRWILKCINIMHVQLVLVQLYRLRAWLQGPLSHKIVTNL